MEDHPPTPPRARRLRWIAWPLVVLFCGGLVAADALVELDRVRRQRAWEYAWQMHVARETWAKLVMLVPIKSAMGKSLEELRPAWGLDRMRKVVSTQDTVRYALPGDTFDPRAGDFTVSLYFTRDTLSAYSIMPPPAPPRPAFALYSWFHRAVVVLALVFAGAWLAFLLAPFQEKSRAPGFGEAALGATLLALTAAVVWGFGPYGRSRTLWSYIVTVGFTMLLTSAIVFVRGLRDRRRNDGRCARCSYDLTGNESGVCPECGTTTPAGLRRLRDEEEAAFVAALEGRASAAAPPPDDLATRHLSG